MKIHSNQLANVVSEYATTHVLPKAPTTTSQFAVGFLIPYIGGAVNKMLDQYSALAHTIGIVDERELVDIEAAYQAAVSGLEKAGGRITVAGIVLDRSDIDALHDIANKHRS